MKYNNVIPTVFILMSERSTGSYVRALTELKNLNTNLKPQLVMTDFDHAALLALERIFHNAQQHGCFSHVSQSVSVASHSTNSCSARTVHNRFRFRHFTPDIIAALAFIPLLDIVRSFEELIDSPFVQQNEEVMRDLVKT